MVEIIHNDIANNVQCYTGLGKHRERKRKRGVGL